MRKKTPARKAAPARPARGLTYRDAGVDIDEGDALVEDIKKVVKPTMRPEVLGGVGGFGALVRIPRKYRSPILVSGTDGVGTKLKLAIEAKRYDGLGIDLVAMCVNDILVSGAEPLFFLDYYATGKLERKVAAAVVGGIAEGCRQAGAALVGGETAEMPGMYAKGDFDLAGFAVGVVEEDAIIDGTTIAPGDALLAPTRIYVKPVIELMRAVTVKGMAHITGGGITENLPRVFPQGCAAAVDLDSWKTPAVFDWLQQQGRIADAEMRRTFNCGVGFVLVVNAADVPAALGALAPMSPWVIGEIVAGDEPVVHYR